MKAVFIRQHGDPSVIQYGDMPDPVAGPGEVLVRVRASALNRLDLYTRAGIRGTKIKDDNPDARNYHVHGLPFDPRKILVDDKTESEIEAIAVERTADFV